jgi:N-hydroxyarylamine O-acetyltransferase
VGDVNTDAYLDRINYRGSLASNAQTLRQLHLAHLLTVPFENLSIHYGEPIVLEEKALFDKVVRRRRGGFCYELNGLFAGLLRTLGFRVAMLSAGVMNAAGEVSPEFDHMALLVQLDDCWLADVGFGDLFREPLLLEQHMQLAQGEHLYRFDWEGHRFTLMRQDGQGTWSGQYRFGLTPYTFADFAARCHYHQTAPQSHFKQGRICTRATVEGRITLSERRMIVTTAAGRQERELANETEYAEALREQFGIVLAGDAADPGRQAEGA